MGPPGRDKLFESTTNIDSDQVGLHWYSMPQQTDSATLINLSKVNDKLIGRKLRVIGRLATTLIWLNQHHLNPC